MADLRRSQDELPAKRQKLETNDEEKTVENNGVSSENGLISNASIDQPEYSIEKTLSAGNNAESGSNCENVCSEVSTENSQEANLNKDSGVKVQRTELDVGISEYISDHKGFSGILKQRYSDFLVNERDREGNVLHLTNTDLPPEYIQEKMESSVLSCEAIEKLEELVKGEDKTKKITVEVEDDKDKRTLVHREIREKFPMLESDTCDVDGHKAVQAFFPVKTNPRRRKNDWPKDRGEYCHFSLYKENKDTMQAINLLSKLTKVKADRFSYAGTKDGRAVTVQRVSAFRIDVKNLLGLNKVLKNICLGNFQFQKKPLKLGDLSGNSFTIVLRNLNGCSEDEVAKRMTSLKERGFINYYGLQRFGTSHGATHSIGLCLLKSQWLQAVDLILTPRGYSNGSLYKACVHYKETRQASDALKLLDGRRCIEGFVLEGLSRYGDKDIVRALGMLPRNTRLMYVHAYQSYIWNMIASKRIKEYGLCPIVGDLVFDQEKGGSQGNDVAVKVLTKDDVENKTYSIHDILLPLPGYDVIYPDHEAREWYESLLTTDGVDIHNMRHKVKDYSLSGAYRHMVILPDNVDWSILKYDDPTIPLALTDLARSRGDPEPASVPDGKLEALRIEFCLPTSCYATMAIREVLKTDTSAFFQSSLNEG